MGPTAIKFNPNVFPYENTCILNWRFLFYSWLIYFTSKRYTMLTRMHACHGKPAIWDIGVNSKHCMLSCEFPGRENIPIQIAKFMGPTWGPPGSCRTQMGPMLAQYLAIRDTNQVTWTGWIYCAPRYTWWRHQMETFSALLALCAGNSPVPVNSPHKGQWRGPLMFSFICVSINDWVNNREAGDLRRHRGHYDVNVMIPRNVQTVGALLCFIVVWYKSICRTESRVKVWINFVHV